MQVPCATLHDVVTFLVDKTEGALAPLVLEEAYEKSISTWRTPWLTCLYIGAPVQCFLVSLQLLFGLIMKTERRAFSRRPSTPPPRLCPPNQVAPLEQEVHRGWNFHLWKFPPTQAPGNRCLFT